MSGKLLIEWRHDLCAEISKKRYVNDQEMLRQAHAEIVNLFFPQENSDESDEINSETSDKSSKFWILTSKCFPTEVCRKFIKTFDSKSDDDFEELEVWLSTLSWMETFTLDARVSRNSVLVEWS